jgi:LysR family transcriptional regulator AphB
MYDDIALFINIVQNRGLASAAQQLDIPAATVTRRLQKLEHALGCQLIHRSPRQFVLTPEGETYYHAYADQIKQLDVTQRSLSAEVHQMSGKLKVLAPTNISIGFLQPMWSSFIKTYPGIQLEVSLSNQFEDMLVSQADLALRIGPQKDSQLYQKRLGTLQTVLVASSEYIEKNGEPIKPEELCQHCIIDSKANSNWSLIDSKSGEKKVIYLQPDTLANDVSFIAQLACDGIGVALLPISEVETYILHGKLVRILHEWRGANRDIYAVWPTGRLLNAKAQCLRDYMYKYLELNPNGIAIDPVNHNRNSN